MVARAAARQIRVGRGILSKFSCPVTALIKECRGGVPSPPEFLQTISFSFDSALTEE